MTKKLLSLLLTTLLAFSVQAFDPDEDETNCADCGPRLVKTQSFEGEPSLKLSVFYAGSPVDQAMKMVLEATCSPGRDLGVIFEQKECDFSSFEYKNSEFSYQTHFYNPVTGQCDRKVTKSTLQIKELCSKRP